MNFKIKIISALALTLILPVIVSATDYYVDKESIGGTCSDSNPGTSESQPWCTIRKSNSVLQAGDTAYIRQGIYTDNDGGAIINPDNSGSAGNPITYTNYQDEEVILRSVTDDTLTRGAFINRNYITINGLVIDNIAQSQSKMTHGVLVSGSKHHVIIQNCIIRYMASGVTFGIRLGDGCEYIKILNNTINYVGYDGIKFQETSSFCHTRYCLVEGNTLVGSFGHSCLLPQGQYHIIRNNLISNNRDKGMDVMRWTSSANSPSYTVIEGNDMYDCTSGDGMEPGMQHMQRYTIIRKNRFYRNTQWGFNFYGRSTGNTNNNKIYNNIFYDNGKAGVNNAREAIKFGDADNNNNCINNVIKNNIFYNNYEHHTGPATLMYQGSSASDQTFANNWWHDDGDPKFVDAANGNFETQSDSDCIDNGGWLTITRSADNGRTIPVQDAGYFTDGHGLIEGDLIQLQGQAQTARITNVNYDTNTLTVNRALTWTSGLGVSLAYSGSAPDIGAYEYGGSTPPPECGDNNCDPGETCSSCPQDCSCSSPQICCNNQCITPACNQNSNCGSDPCKTYVCNNPGTCSASCSSQDKTSCVNNDNCCPTECNEQNDNDCNATPSNLVATWNFDEGTGTTTTDSSGNNNHGTINGATWTNGITGNALEFDGNNDYVNVPEDNSLDPEEITIETWMLIPSAPTSNGNIVSKGGNNGYRFIINTARAIWWADRGTTNSIKTTRLVPLNEWTHITVVGSNTGMRIYINGELSASNSVSYGSPNTGSSLKIGAEPQYNGYFKGIIDEVRIYNQALSAQEILEHYQDSTPIPGDLNNDGDVNFIDLIIVASNFGSTNTVADTDNNSIVDIFDVVFVASRFTS